MSFVYPAFLWALAALSIPIIVHLFNFRKTQKIYFSSNRFLRMVQEATSAKRKLKHYLILASRLLFILFLVLAFAQPFIPAREQVSSVQNIILYLDNSLSMSVPVGEKVRALDAGIQTANELVSVFPPDTRFQLITNDFAPFSNNYKTRSEILDLLTQVRLSPVSRTFHEVMERIGNTNRGLAQREIFWISDLQQSTMGSLDGIAIDSARRLHLIPVTPLPAANIFVDSAYLENPFVVGGEKNTLHVKLRNDGNRAVEQLMVRLSLNGVQAGTGAVNLPAKGENTVTFDLVSSSRTARQAVISFNDYPVSFDNEFFLALNFAEKIKVIEIKASPSATPVERVFGNRDVFTFRSYDSRNISYAALGEADLIVVNALERMDNSLVQALRNYGVSGGTLLLIPAAAPDLSSYRELLNMPTLSSVSEPQLVEMDNPDINNPFFENVFEEKSNRLVLPKVRRVLDWGTDRSALLRLKNDKPFLSVLNRGGQVYLMASPLQTGYSDLSGNFLFLPVMYRIAASGKKSSWKPYHDLRETLITLRADSLLPEQQVKLAGQQEIIPSQRKLTDRVIMELPRHSLQAGFYHAVTGRDTLGLLAFNLNNRESLLDPLTPEAFKQQLGNGDHITIFDTADGMSFSNEIKARYLGTPLWKYALLLALFFLLVEILLIRFIK
jgi:hypothetical protein